MGNGFEILVWAIFPQMYLWIHDKYSSIRFKQCEWQKKKYFNTINFDQYMAHWSHSPVLRGCIFLLEEFGVQLGSNPGVAISFVFLSLIVFLPFGFLLFILTADPNSFARFLRKRISSRLFLSTVCKKNERMHLFSLVLILFSLIFQALPQLMIA